jgi:hypothetical protein
VAKLRLLLDRTTIAECPARDVVASLAVEASRPVDADATLMREVHDFSGRDLLGLVVLEPIDDGDYPAMFFHKARIITTRAVVDPRPNRDLLW